MNYQRAFVTPRDGVMKDGVINYRASKFDSDAYPLKPNCCPNAVARKIACSIYEAARDKGRAVAKTAAYAILGREGKKEMLFAHLERILRLDRLGLRGLNARRTSSYWPAPPKI